MTIDNELALEFLRKAEQDLGSARLLLTSDNLFDTACFHCQQLAEKSIKSLLTHRSIRFNKIHDLDISEMERGKRTIGKESARKFAEALKTDYRVFL